MPSSALFNVYIDLECFSCAFAGSKSKPKAKREKTEEEKTFRRRAKYFLATQLVAVLVFLSVFGGAENAEDGDEDGLDYDD